MNIDLEPRQVRQICQAIEAIEAAERSAAAGQHESARASVTIAGLRITALRGHCEVQDVDPVRQRYMDSIDADLRHQLARARARLPAVA